MITQQIKLAIVIPAYNSEYLSQTLESIINQSDQRFNLYIGNDNSPYDIESIINEYKDKRRLVYKHFPNNLGNYSLTKHWSRCIDMTTDEEYIWLFPDDDIMSPLCVASFYSQLKKVDNPNLLRFNNCHINERNEPITKVQKLPPTENAKDYCLARISLHRFSSLAEHIFSRKIYTKKKGFVDFPAAWFADDATWLIFSENNMIYTINQGIVLIRQSSLNISNNETLFQKEKLTSLYLYINLIVNKKILSIEPNKEALLKFIFMHYKGLNKKFNLLEILKFSWKNTKLFKDGYLKNAYRLIKYKIKNV